MNTITTLIQAAERMIRDTKTPMGELCATWNRLNFEANTGLSFSTPTRRSKLIERLEAAIIELNSRDDRMGWDGKDNREFSGNSIAADHDEALKMNREHTTNLRKDDINTLKSIAKAVNAGDRTLKDSAGECNYYKWQTNCPKASAIYGRLAECKTRKQFAAILETIEEAPRYFVADRVYKVSPAGFVTVWNNTGREWVDVDLSIINLINMGATEVTEADINAYTTIPLATVSTDKGRWFVLVNANNNRQHLYEFHNEQDAVEYAQRVNGL